MERKLPKLKDELRNVIMTTEQVKTPRKYKKKKRVAILANSDDAKQTIIDFMSEFLCEQILNGRLKVNEQNNSEQ